MWPYIQLHKCIYTIRKLFLVEEKDGNFIRAVASYIKIFLENRHLLFSFRTQLIIWLPTLSACRERMCWLQPQEPGGHCSSSGYYCPYKDILVITVVLGHLVSMGLTPWVYQFWDSDMLKCLNIWWGKKHPLGLGDITKNSWQVACWSPENISILLYGLFRICEYVIV